MKTEDDKGPHFSRFSTRPRSPLIGPTTCGTNCSGNSRDKNNRNRSIAAQVLCNLAKSDPSKRMLRDFPALFDVVNDERFVTARHALQAMWKVGCVGKKHQDLLVAALAKRFSDCAHAQELHFDPLRHHRVPSEAV